MLLRKQAQACLVRQQDESDCGVACLATLLRFYGGENWPLEHLREISGTTISGTTLLGLQEAGAQLHLQTKGLRADSLDQLRTALERPVLLHTVVGHPDSGALLAHYIVCFGWLAEQNCFVVGDPAQGVVLYSAQELEAIWPTKVLMTFTPSEQFISGKQTRHARLRWLLQLVRTDAPALGIATGLGAITAALGLSTAIFSQRLIDKILPAHDSTRLYLGVALLAVLLVARTGISYLRTLILNQQSRDFNNRLISDFFGKLLRLPKSFFDHRKTGELVTRLNDTSRIQRAVTYLAGNFIVSALFVTVAIVYISCYSLMAGALVLLSVPLLYGLARAYTPALMASYRSTMQAASLNESQYIDTIKGIAVVKAGGHEEYFQAKTQTTYGNLQQYLLNLNQVSLRFNTWAELAGAGVLVAILALSSFMVLHQQLRLGEMVAVIAMAGSVIPVVGGLALTNIQLQEAYIASERMFEYTQLRAAPPIGSLITPTITSLELINVSFRYPGRPLLLNAVSFILRRGEVVAITGENGSGKSTLFQVLQRFYAPSAGQILVNDQDWNLLSTSSWYRAIGVVPQQPQLFTGSLFDNVCVGCPASDYDQFLSFCQQWGFQKYFEQFPQGYATRLGESGVAISGGQQQLVALARALYRQPQVLLLDEPTAAMDSHTEQFVLSVLERLRPQCAVLLTTHRSTMLHSVDHHYCLSRGHLSQVTELPTVPVFQLST